MDVFIQHVRVLFSEQHTCAVCAMPFSKNQDLEQHSSALSHPAFRCACGKQFSRASCLTRHINSHVGTKYQREWCDNKSFPRLDKLRDHLRAFHRFGTRALSELRGRMSAQEMSDTSTPSPDYMVSGPDILQHEPATSGLAFPAPATATAPGPTLCPVAGYPTYDPYHISSVSHLRVSVTDRPHFPGKIVSNKIWNRLTTASRPQGPLWVGLGGKTNCSMQFPPTGMGARLCVYLLDYYTGFLRR